MGGIPTTIVLCICKLFSRWLGHQTLKEFIWGKFLQLLIYLFKLQLSFSVKRYHFSFDQFDNTQCSGDLFERSTNIWEQNDVCPSPKTYYLYLPTYTGYSHQNIFNRARRASAVERGPGPSIDVSYCKDASVYQPENILLMQNRLCCLQPNFRDNAIAQITRSGGTTRDGRENFKATRDLCCEQYKEQTDGVDALQTIGCPFSR